MDNSSGWRCRKKCDIGRLVARNLPIWSGNNRCHTCQTRQFVPQMKTDFSAQAAAGIRLDSPALFWHILYRLLTKEILRTFLHLENIARRGSLLSVSASQFNSLLQLKWNTNSKLLCSKLACWTQAACVLIANNFSSGYKHGFKVAKHIFQLHKNIISFPRRDILLVVAKPMHKSFSCMHNFNQFWPFMSCFENNMAL